jgi:hypothetical protein
VRHFLIPLKGPWAGPGAVAVPLDIRKAISAISSGLSQHPGQRRYRPVAKKGDFGLARHVTNEEVEMSRLFKRFFAVKQTTDKLTVEKHIEVSLENHSCSEAEANWVPDIGRESGSTGEQQYHCKVCGKKQYRGGWLSSWQYE